jgi:deazaflavin-dependent oxidoreductase (nitroreductase family)
MPSNSHDYLYLTTIGRRSGEPREIEIWFTAKDGAYYVIAEYDTSHWVRNLQANPQVAVRVEDRRLAARARVVDSRIEPELHAAVQQLSRQKYGWGEGLVVELQPEPDGSVHVPRGPQSQEH